MKKLLSIIAISVMLLPLGAKAGEFKFDCDKSCPTEDGKCTATCQVKVENPEAKDFSIINGKINIASDGVKITKFTAGSGWTPITPSATDSLDGKELNVSLSANPSINSSEFILFSLNLEIENKDVDCSLAFTPEGSTTIETTIETTTTTKTGASLPVVIIAGGAIVAIAIYTVTKKNKKLYKI